MTEVHLLCVYKQNPWCWLHLVELVAGICNNRTNTSHTHMSAFVHQLKRARALPTEGRAVTVAHHALMLGYLSNTFCVAREHENGTEPNGMHKDIQHKRAG